MTINKVEDFTKRLRSLLDLLGSDKKNSKDLINEHHRGIIKEWASKLPTDSLDKGRSLRYIIEGIKCDREVRYVTLYEAIDAVILRQQVDIKLRVFKATKAFVRQHKRPTFIGVSVLVLLIAIAIYHFSNKAPTPFKKFATSTENLFENINRIQLPASNDVIRYKIECLRAANMVESSPAFPFYGQLMAESLRNFGNKVSDAGNSLQAMYRRGNSLFEKFDIELRDLMRALHGDGYSISGHGIEKLREQVERYRAKVAETSQIILDTKRSRDWTEKQLVDGKREGEDFLHKATSGEPIVKSAIEELSVVITALKHMNDMAFSLESLHFFLVQYDQQLLEMEAEFKNSYNKRDTKYFQRLTDNLKKQHAISEKDAIAIDETD